MLRLRVRFALLLLATAASSVGTAHAQATGEEQARAREHFERGTRLYDAGSYAEAQAEFRASYDLVQHPDLLYNLYTAAERNGDLAVAIEALQGYLRGGQMEAARREALEARLERLLLRQEREVAERERRDRAQADAARQLEEEHAERERAQAEADRARADRREAVRAGHATSDALLFTGVGALAAGGVAGVLFAAFGGLSEAEDGRLAGSCGRDAGRLCLESDVAELRTWNTAADASWIAASALALTGLVLVLIAETTRPSARADDEVAVRPWLGPAGLGPGGLNGATAGVHLEARW